MENCAAKKTHSSTAKKDHYRPSGNFLRIRKLFVKQIKVVLIAVYFLLHLLDMFFQLLEPSTVKFFIDSLEHQRCQVSLELSFCFLKFSCIFFYFVLDTALHAFNFSFKYILILF